MAGDGLKARIPASLVAISANLATMRRRWMSLAGAGQTRLPSVGGTRQPDTPRGQVAPAHETVPTEWGPVRNGGGGSCARSLQTGSCAK